MIDVLFILLFSIGVNWIVSLHFAFQSTETAQQKALIMVVSLLMGVCLGVIVI
jgi:hypothetical protein